MSSFRRIFPVYLIVFFGYVGYSLFITVFPPMLLHQAEVLLYPHASEKVKILSLGILLALYPFGQFISSPILGALSDRFGRRPILIYSLVLTTLVYIMIAIGIWFRNYFIVATALLIAGLSEGNTALSQSVIADVATEEEQTRFFGYVYFSAAAAFILGPLIGGRLTDSQMVSWFSYETPFLLIACLLFATLLLVLIGFRETHPIHHREKISYFEAFTNLKNIFKMPHVRPYYLVNFLIFLGIYGFFQGFPIHIVTRFHLTASMLGYFIAWASVPFLVINLLLTGPLSKKMTPSQIIIISAFWIGIFLEVGLFLDKEWTLWGTLFLIGCGIALCLPATSTMLARLVSRAERGRVLGNNLSLQFFSEAFVGLLIGLLASFFLKFTIIFFGIITILGGVILLVLKLRKPLA